MSGANIPTTADPAHRHARDVRIDFFRGIALLSIFINHMPGNILSRFTLYNFGFSDAAELFVLLAGVSAAIAYGRRGNATTRILSRAATLYLAHVTLLFLVGGTLIFAAVLFDHPALTDHAMAAPFLDHPLHAIVQVLTLTWQPKFFDILTLYLALMLWLPVFLRLCRVDVRLAMAISVAIWAIANIYTVNLPSSRDAGWFFNPLAWQLLFSIGVVIGLYAPANASGVVVKRSPVVVAGAFAFLAFGVLWAAPWASFSASPLFGWRPVAPEMFGELDKTYLPLWRLAHVLCLAYAAAWCVTRDARWLASWWAGRLIAMGRHSLTIFILASIMSVAGQLIFSVAGKSLVQQCVVNALGVTLLTYVGHIKVTYRNLRVASGWPAWLMSPIAEPDVAGPRGMESACWSLRLTPTHAS